MPDPVSKKGNQSDKEYENYRFAFIIGIDRANTITDWYNSDELLKFDVPFVVIPRQGIARDYATSKTWHGGQRLVIGARNGSQTLDWHV